MSAYSKDLRLKVLAAVDRGVPRSETVEMFGVSLVTLKRWLKKRREGEDLQPGTSTGRKRRILATAEERHALCSHALLCPRRLIRRSLTWRFALWVTSFRLALLQLMLLLMKARRNSTRRKARRFVFVSDATNYAASRIFSCVTTSGVDSYASSRGRVAFLRFGRGAPDREHARC